VPFKEMPQLDKVTWFSQIFWFLVVFLSFYFVMLFCVLPTVAASLKLRAKKLGKLSAVRNTFSSDKQGQIYKQMVHNSLFVFPTHVLTVKQEIDIFVLKLSVFLKDNLNFKKVVKDSSRLLFLVRFMQEEIKKNA